MRQSFHKLTNNVYPIRLSRKKLESAMVVAAATLKYMVATIVAE